MASEELHGLSQEVRERRRRSVITALLVLLMLFFAAWYAQSYIRADDDPGAEAPMATSASPSTSCVLTPEQVEVNVFNATSTEGLAAQVARDLRRRGFVVTTVANDPKHAEVAGHGHLSFGSAGARPAELVAQHVGRFDERPDERKRASVDIVVGPKYRELLDETTISDC